jgi:hypothetical protein
LITYLHLIIENKFQPLADLFQPFFFNLNTGVCPKKWMQLKERCYYFSELYNKFSKSWQAANNRCKAMYNGSTLVSIRNKEEQDFINRKCWLLIKYFFYD